MLLARFRYWRIGKACVNGDERKHGWQRGEEVTNHATCYKTQWYFRSCKGEFLLQLPFATRCVTSFQQGATCVRGSCWLNRRCKKNHICPFGAWQARFLGDELQSFPLNKCYFWALTQNGHYWFKFSSSLVCRVFPFRPFAKSPTQLTLTDFEISEKTLNTFDG